MSSFDLNITWVGWPPKAAKLSQNASLPWRRKRDGTSPLRIALGRTKDVLPTDRTAGTLFVSSGKKTSCRQIADRTDIPDLDLTAMSISDARKSGPTDGKGKQKKDTTLVGATGLLRADSTGTKSRGSPGETHACWARRGPKPMDHPEQTGQPGPNPVDHGRRNVKTASSTRTKSRGSRGAAQEAKGKADGGDRGRTVGKSKC